MYNFKQNIPIGFENGKFVKIEKFGELELTHVFDEKSCRTEASNTLKAY